jgi:hypothetical protein
MDRQAIEGLIQKWRFQSGLAQKMRGHAGVTSREKAELDAEARVHALCADQLEALLRAQETSPSHAACHDGACNGDRRYPRGAQGVSCSCAGRDARSLCPSCHPLLAPSDE